MYKPSNIIKAFDNSAECKNFAIEEHNSGLLQVIRWLCENYNDIYSLKRYFLDCAFNNRYVNYREYFQYINSLSATQIQNEVDKTIYIFYKQIKYNESQKINTTPFKIMDILLRRYNY